LELEDSIPSTADAGSGSTGIVMFRKRNRLYIANTGDSFALVGSYDTSNKNVNIVYETKPHKPHLKEERARIEAAGGQVVEPQGPGDSSRVIIPMDEGGLAMALAMSRSIGDKQGTSLGVIANPTIDVLDLNTLEVGKELFAVVASDGLFDKVNAKQVAETIATSLFDETATKTPLEACHELIMKSSFGWIAQGSPYRDDISVATTILVREND
jgi:serine/threonine protein phosphatase PrpC